LCESSDPIGSLVPILFKKRGKEGKRGEKKEGKRREGKGKKKQGQKQSRKVPMLNDEVRFPLPR